MRVRFWGVRGSIPVSGDAYSIFGGDTACLEVRSPGGQLLILDAGTGLRGLGNILMDREPEDLHLLLTHFHWDHILGLPFFKPLYDGRFRITIRGPLAPQELEATLAKLWRRPYFPVPFELVRPRLAFAALHEQDQVAGFSISAIPLSHDAPGIGLRIESADASLVFLTDNELGHGLGQDVDKYAAFAQGAGLLVHDAEYTEAEYAHRRGWGHSSQERALDLALAAGVRRFAMFHHNQDREDHQVRALEAQCRERAARVRPDMDCFAAAQGMVVEL